MADQQTLTLSPDKTADRAGLIWVVLLCGLGLLAVVVLEVRYTAWLDLCDPVHESPQTIFAYGLAAFVTLTPAAWAVFARSYLLLAFAVVGLVVESLAWWWLLSPVGNCVP